MNLKTLIGLYIYRQSILPICRSDPTSQNISKPTHMHLVYTIHSTAIAANDDIAIIKSSDGQEVRRWCCWWDWIVGCAQFWQSIIDLIGHQQHMRDDVTKRAYIGLTAVMRCRACGPAWPDDHRKAASASFFGRAGGVVFRICARIRTTHTHTHDSGDKKECEQPQH